MRFKSIFLLFFCCFISNVFAQTYDFKNYTISDGLIQSTVNDIKQDKNGYLWIATDGGLSRFDGISFKNYSSQNGLPETVVNAICFDADGDMWIGGATGKIYLFSNEKFYQFNIIEDTICKRIQHLIIDSRNNLWASTEGLGVIKIKLNKKNKLKSLYTFYNNQQVMGDAVHQAYEDKEGFIWLITQNGLRRQNPRTNDIEIYTPGFLPKYYYTSISEDKKGNLILGTYGNGLCILNNNAAEVYFYDETLGLPQSINPFAKQVKDSSIWVSIWDKGLARISKGEIKIYDVQNGLPSNKVRCSFQDNEGNLWFGTQDNGIAVYRGNKFSHFNKRNGLTDNVVNAITKLGNKLIVGTNFGLNIITNGAISNMQIQEFVGSNLITSFAIGNKNNFYVSTFGGSILVIDKNTLKPIGTLQLKENLVNALYFDKNDVLWVATNKGVSFFKNNENLIQAPVKAAQLDDIEAVSFFCDSKNNLWIGTRRSGLIKVTNNQLKFYNETHGLKSKNATSICEDSNGNIWIGTEGGGLYSFVNDKFTHYNTGSGLLSDFITTLSCKNNVLFMGTNKGICKYDLNTKSFNSYNQFDGFKELEVKPQSMFVDDDKIWFGTINGLASLNISELTTNKIAPSIVLTKMEIFGNDYAYKKDLKLDYTKKDITFYFGAISLTAPEKVVYQYFLKGSDDKWHTAAGGVRFATYTNLTYGNYTFMVKAMNGDGVWSGIKEFNFNIEAPFWKKTWFWILLIVFSIAFGIWFSYQRQLKLRKDNEYLESQVKERTKEIEHKNDELISKNVDISLKNKEITDSINYAKRLQDSILPDISKLKDSLGDIFILYKPKSIVSGDFYWYTPIQNQNEEREFVLAAADCTGHGVPGAFMCMVATSLLNQIVVDKKTYEPAEVLKDLNIGVRSVLKQHETETRDGMDIALCRINLDKLTIEFAGALRPLYIYRDLNKGEKKLTDYYFEEIKPNKFPIGGLQFESTRNFDNHKIQLNKGDTIYMFSDGFADQFGGAEGKKLMTKKFKEMLHEQQLNSMEEQKNYLENFFSNWCGDQEQIDDVMVLGIRF